MKNLMPTACLAAALLALCLNTARAEGVTLVTVNGQAITDEEYRAALNGKPEEEAGKSALRKLVFAALVRQAAQKAAVMATDADVTKRLEDVRRRTPQLLVAADANPALMKTLLDDLQTDIALENLRMQNVAATPAEVEAFYQAHQTAFTLPPQVKTTVVVTETRALSQAAEKLLKKNVGIEAIAARPGFHVAGLNGFAINLGALPAARREQISKTVLAMQTGQVKTLVVTDAGATHFLTFRVSQALRQRVPPLSEIRPQVERLARLQKSRSPQTTLAALYQAAQITFNQPQYASYFDTVGGDKPPANPGEPK